MLQESIEKFFTLGLRSEIDSYDLYLSLFNILPDSDEKSIFLRLARNEKEHLARLLSRSEFMPPCIERLLQDLIDLKKLEKRLSMEQIRSAKGNITFLQALKMALKMERKSYLFYSYFARKIKDPDGKTFLYQISVEELEHISLIRDGIRRGFYNGNRS